MRIDPLGRAKRVKFGWAHKVGKRGEDRLPKASESARMGKGVKEHNRGVW